jgi:large subunit ribosomal protein L15
MELYNLKSAPGARKKRKRVGRGPGSGSGKTSGRGHKGQKSRAGYSHKYGFEGGQMPLHRRLPKRGFTHRKRWPTAIINVDLLDRLFNDGDEVTVGKLVSAKIIPERAGGVKVLGRGDLTKKLTVRVQAASPSAKEKIESAGGSLELVKMAVHAVETAEETKPEETAVPVAEAAEAAEAVPGQAVPAAEAEEKTEAALAGEETTEDDSGAPEAGEEE